MIQNPEDMDIGDFNPRSPHGERLFGFFINSPGFYISIHALLTESDVMIQLPASETAIFQSTLSSRRATTFSWVISGPSPQFQSTLSSRRATSPGVPSFPGGPYFNPRSPHGERR